MRHSRTKGSSGQFNLTRFILLVALCTCCWMVLWSFTHGAVAANLQARANPSLQELRRWRQTINEYNQGVRQQRQQLEQLEGAARDRLEGLQTNVRLTGVQIRQAEQNLLKAQDSLATLEVEYQASIDRYEARLDSTVARLRFLQRRRADNTWAMLLDSANLNELMNRRQQLQQVYRADQKLLVGLKAENDRLAAQKKQIEFQVVQIEHLRSQLQQQQVALSNEAAQQEQLVDKITADRVAMEAAENQLERDSVQVTAMIRQRLAYVAPSAPDDILIRGTGRLSIPINAPITSHFGYRVHPILGTRRLHSGTDFGADTGTPIRAAEAGTVVYAGWQGGYGNTIIIDHGGGMTTLYAHCSQLYARNGQTVQKGEAIAAVGSTGMSTGPHLHFEVRINGEPQNPLAYIGGAA